MLLHPTGLPNDNDTVYCPVNQSTCYWQQPSSYTYQQSQARCASLGGYIASWSDPAEQLQIENYFRVGASTDIAVELGTSVAINAYTTSCAAAVSFFCGSASSGLHRSWTELSQHV